MSLFRWGRSEPDQPHDVATLALEAIADGIVVTDRAGVVRFANAAYRALCATTENAATASVERLFGGEAATAEALFRLARAARGGASAREMLRLPGQSAAWFAVAIRPLPSRPELALWQLRSAPAPTRHARVEDFRAVLDRLPVGVYVAAADGALRFVNARLAQWLGLSVAELIETGLHVDDFLEQGFEILLSPTDEDAGMVPQLATILRRHDGRRLPVLLARAPAETGGQVASIQAVLQPLSGGRQVDGLDSELRLVRFFENAPIGIVITAPDGTIRAANAAFRAMLGQPLRLGTPFADLAAAEGREEVRRRIAGAAESDAAVGLAEIRLAGSEDIVAQLYISRIGEGAEGAVVLYLIDTTEQKNLELQFAQSQKMQAVGQLAGGIAHDFNNLLTAVIGFCDLLLMRHRPGDPSFGDIMQIKQNANRAANLVRQLLAFSRKQTLRPKVLMLTDELAELSHLLRRLLGERIELHLVHERDLGYVKVDQGQLEQVIVNLAVNARDAMPTGGVLTIRTASISEPESSRLGHALMTPGEYVLIEVSDTGTGIPKENLSKIFEPFFTTKEVGKGTGLGLSTVYGIVKQTGGFIFPSSEPGKGTTFRIYLPRHWPEVEAPPPETVEREVGTDLTGKATILLVEDEDAVRAFALRALTNKGYTVLEAADGETALGIVKTHSGPIDLMISDVVMPNMDGPTLLREVHQHRPDMKIIFISGYAEDAFRKGVDCGTDFRFLPKPFSLKQLASTVKEVLG
jgi:two-component system cell cycle sensor histidine kinase/response regulator CckA